MPTVNEVVAADRSVADGVVVDFAYTFKIYLKTDIEVLVDDTAKVVDTDFSVSGLGASGGGTVTFFTAPANLAVVTRLRKQPASQLSVYTPNEDFPAARIEKDFDKVVMLVQQLWEKSLRSLTFKKSSTLTNRLVDTPVVGSFARAKTGGGIDWATVVPAGSLSVPVAIADGGTGETTAAAARTALDVPSTSEVMSETLIDAKGDLLVGTANDAVARKAVGADGTVLMPLAAVTDGLHYQSGVLSGWAILGGRLVATVSAKALTIAIKNDAGTDPSATAPVWVACRSVTLTDGQPVFRKVTAATAVVVPSGATLGFSAALTSRIYIVALDNAGTVELAVYHPYNPTGPTLLGVNEAALNTSTTIGTGSDSAQVLYSTTGRTNVAVRVVGYLEIATGGVAGEWDNEDSVIQMMGPGVKRTGDLVQTRYVASGALATGTTVMPADDTAPGPQNTEGDQYSTLAITPTSAMNILDHELFGAAVSSSAAGYMTLALFQDSTATTIACSVMHISGTGNAQAIPLRHRMRAGTAASTTFNLRAGNNAAGTTTWNGHSGARLHNGLLTSYQKITEVFV